MTKPQKITTEIILADFIPAPARTPELAREITAAIRADNQVALEYIVQRTQQAFAAQQKQIDTQQIELSQIRQEVKQLKRLNRQPQITYNISDNRSINYIQSTSNSWNTYNQNTHNQSNHSQNNYTNYTDSTYETSWNTHNQSSQSRNNHSQSDYTDSTYETSWNTYGQSAYSQPKRLQHSQGHNYNEYDRQRDTYTENDSAANSFDISFLKYLWPLPFIAFITWTTWLCENQQKMQQTPPQIQRAR